MNKIMNILIIFLFFIFLNAIIVKFPIINKLNKNNIQAILVLTQRNIQNLNLKRKKY